MDFGPPHDSETKILKQRLCNSAKQPMLLLTLTLLLQALAGTFSSSAEFRSIMTSQTEMDHFFARNCYTEAERQRVKAWHPYQAAMEKNDIIEAQEIAMRVIERGLGLSSESFRRTFN